MYQPQEVGIGTVSLVGEEFRDPANRAQAFSELEQRFTNLPGIEKAGFASRVSGLDPLEHVKIWRDGNAHSANSLSTTADAAEVLGLSILHGRSFSTQDRLGSVVALLISESLAARLFDNSLAAVGGKVTVDLGGVEAPAEVVGIIRDPPQSRFGELNSRPLVVRHLLQEPRSGARLVANTRSSPETLRAELSEQVADIVPFSTLEDWQSVAASIRAGQRLPDTVGRAATMFAIAGLLLTLLGCRALLFSELRRRRVHIAIRAALGATPRSATKLYSRSVVRASIIGALLGSCLALFAVGELVPEVSEVPLALRMTGAGFAVIVLGGIGTFGRLLGASPQSNNQIVAALRE